MAEYTATRRTKLASLLRRPIPYNYQVQDCDCTRTHAHIIATDTYMTVTVAGSFLRPVTISTPHTPPSTVRAITPIVNKQITTILMTPKSISYNKWK